MTLTFAGGAIMIVSVSSVLLLTAFCIYRVLALPAIEVTEHLKAPLEIDTRDRDDAD